MKYKNMQKIAIVPSVGLFWIYAGKVYSRKVSLKELSFEDGTKAAPFFHVSEWDSIKKQILKEHPTFPQNTLYKEIPRGRIWLNQKESLFVIIASPEIISNKETVVSILNAFNIPTYSSISLKTDTIYEI